MNDPQLFKFVHEPRRETYEALLTWMWQRGEYGLFVIVDGVGISQRAQDFLERLQPYYISQFKASVWPGVISQISPALVTTFRLTKATLDMVVQETDRLYRWCQPDLPEDLTIVGTYPDPLLFSIAHERVGFMCLTIDDITSLRANVPGLRAKLFIERHSK